MNDCPTVEFTGAVHKMYRKLDMESRKGRDLYNHARNVEEVLQAYAFNRSVLTGICNAYKLVGEVYKGLFSHLQLEAQHIVQAVAGDLQEYCKIAEEGGTKVRALTTTPEPGTVAAQSFQDKARRAANGNYFSIDPLAHDASPKGSENNE
jgi:hypothetical protein